MDLCFDNTFFSITVQRTGKFWDYVYCNSVRIKSNEIDREIVRSVGINYVFIRTIKLQYYKTEWKGEGGKDRVGSTCT